MKNFIRIFLFISFICFIPIDADSSWYNDIKTYSQEKIHDIATEDMTFESFYKESSTIGWIAAAVGAVIAVATIFFTGGTASPIVAGIGSWIGGMMGLSGAAATNAGLALLGGGSIASGGLGIVGGTALLTAALSYSTDIVFDYTVGTAVSTYNYNKFSEQSKNMTTLPLPKNSDGCDSYEEAMDILENINEEVSISNSSNQQIIQKAIIAANKVEKDIDKDDLAKNEALLALLNFITNNYEKAKQHALKSINLSKKIDTKYTLPAFIYATSSMYDETFNFDEITNDYFKYSIINEPDNPIIPLLFSIYLDRMMYRFNDNYLKPNALNKVFTIASNKAIEDKKIQNYIIILSRYIIRLKIEQQKISSLTTTANETIKNSVKTLYITKESIKNYTSLINGAEKIIDTFPKLENDEENKENLEKIKTFSNLITEYKNDKDRLKNLIDSLEKYQQNSSKKTIKKEEFYNNYYIYIILGFLLLLIAFLFYKKD
ncbi:MAG: hypothetical protein GXO60_09620 [Epsilonproteobacteria bacterium]|nr:hypothetical protein [Campylobacterota bacterium]